MQTLAPIANPSVELGKNYLKITKELSDTELKQVFESLSFVTGSTLFWIGDFLNTVTSKKSEEYKKTTDYANALSSNGEEYANTVALKTGEAYAKAYANTDYAPSTLWNAKSVCKRIPPHKRVALSYKHHAEALIEAGGDADLAVTYLRAAQERNLSVSQMRKEIRLSLATAPKESEIETVIQQDSEFLAVMSALVTVRRFLENTTSKTFFIKKGYVLSEVEELFELAKRVCQ